MKVTVTVADGFEAQAVADELDDAGFQVSEVMDLVGIVNGDTNGLSLEALRAVPGVDSIEEEHRFTTSEES